MLKFIKKLFTPTKKVEAHAAQSLKEHLQKVVEDYTFKLSETEQEIAVLDDTIATMMNHRAEMAARLSEATDLLNKVKAI